MALGTIQFIVPPHCEPSMPLLGVCQLCGYARSLGFESEVVDLSLDLKAGNINPMTETEFESHGKYWSSIRTLKEGFTSRYAESFFYANPTWDSAIIRAYKWNVFSDQVCFISDCKKACRPLESYVKQIRNRSIADFYFVSIMFASQFLDGLLLCYAIRQVAPNSKIVVGGGLITSLFSKQDDVRGPLAKLADIVSVGAGEFLIQFLAKRGYKQLLKNNSKSQDSIAVLLNARDLEVGQEIKVPMPIYNTAQRYLTHRVVLPYRIGDSCYWNRCSFCTDWLYKSRLRNVSIEEHAQRICDLENISSGVMFQDSALSPDTLRHLSIELSRRKCSLRWGINARFDSGLTYDVLSLARNSGCVFLRFGLESASKKVLTLMHKGIDVDVVRRILIDARKLGILTHVYCIAGYSGETDEDRLATRRFLLDDTAYPDSFNMTQYIPYFATRSNFTGRISHVSDSEWALYPPLSEDRKTRAYVDELERDFACAHPVFRTLISPAHTIGSYDFVRRWS